MKVFISHSSDDKRFVRTLKDDLNENGIHTWFDEDELNLGDSLIEKLESAIEDTSHFIIILSESSVNSPWVQLELNKVLKGIISKNNLKKIIPIKYKECEVPIELAHLLLADVSNLTRVIVGNKLLFSDENYIKFLEKVLKSLKAQDTKLNKTVKTLLTTPINVNQSNQDSRDKKFFKVLIKGFSSNVIREKYSEIVKVSISASKSRNLEILLNKPIILPLFFSDVFKGIKKGDKIVIKNKGNEEKIGLFAGFRKQEDKTLILPASIRNFLNITISENEYDIVVSIKGNEILIL